MRKKRISALSENSTTTKILVDNLKIENMKTNVVKNICLISLLTAGMIIIPGCSKERVEPKNEKTSYEEMDDYYDSNKQEEQEYQIDENGNGPVIGKQGTKIYPDKNKLMYPNGDSVQYPYTVKLVELYTTKDMIFWQMPTVSEGKPLTSEGEVRIRAFKDDVELVLRPAMTWTVEIPSANPLNDMLTYYGEENGASVDWKSEPAGTFNVTAYGYTGEIAQLGWVACSKSIADHESTSVCSFVSDSSNLDNAKIFISFPGLKSLVQVYNQQSIDLPIGESAKIVITAISADNQLFMDYQELNIDTENEISVVLDSVSASQMNSVLDGL
jgi:hypothetical protein